MAAVLDNCRENGQRTNRDQSETLNEFRGSFESRLPGVRKLSRGGLWDMERCRVYFMGGGGLIKIGVTSDIDNRLRKLQLSSPVEIRYLGSFPGVQSDEREMHKKFAHLRRHGEWFTDTPELREEIVRLCGDLWLQERASK